MQIRHVLTGDAGLDGVQQVLLGAPMRRRVRQTLSRMLKSGPTLGPCRLTRAKYKPGKHLTAYFAATLLDGSRPARVRPAEVVWSELPGSDESHAEMEAEAARADLMHPFRCLHTTEDDVSMRLQVWPLDPSFSQLVRVSEPRYLDAALRDLDGHAASPGRFRVTPIRYRPRERHVLRYDVENSSGRYFAKIYNSAKGLRSCTTATRVADWLASETGGMSAVRPLGYIAADQLVLYPNVTGTPLSQRLRKRSAATGRQIHAAGRALRLLHSIPFGTVELQPHSLATELGAIARASEHLQVLAPRARHAILSILERATEINERLPQEAPALAFGDFKSDHVLIAPSGLTLIDFDTCYLSDPAIDVGKFLADLHWWFDEYGIDGVGEAQATFLDGYAPGIPTDRVRRARLFEALVLCKITVRRVRLFDPAWTERTHRLVARATAVLDRVNIDSLQQP